MATEIDTGIRIRHRRRHPIRNAILSVGIATGAVTGIKAGYDSITSSPEPIKPPNPPATISVEPTKSPSPDNSPSTEPTPSPELPTRPTGDILWGDKNAPLGLLTKPEYYTEDGTTNVFGTGILINEKPREITLGGVKEEVHIISINLGPQNSGEDLIASFIIGGLKDNVFIHYMSERSLSIDPHPSTSGEELGQTLMPIEDFLSLIKNGGQYAFRMTINQNTSYFTPECDAIPGCVRYRNFTHFLPYNNRLVEILNSKQGNPKGLGYLNEFYIPRPLQS